MMHISFIRDLDMSTANIPIALPVAWVSLIAPSA